MSVGEIVCRDSGAEEGDNEEEGAQDCKEESDCQGIISFERRGLRYDERDGRTKEMVEVGVSISFERKEKTVRLGKTYCDGIENRIVVRSSGHIQVLREPSDCKLHGTSVVELESQPAR